jgi:glycosyltransferase involved in cell wall biosynthesis
MVKASVCFITYNHAGMVREALESVLAQRASFPFEVVVGDDASTDETTRILSEVQSRHSDRIRLRLGAANAGMAATFLGAFNACSGRYVAILEGDERFTSPIKLQLQVAAMEANPSATLCGTNALVRDERHPERSRVFPADDDAYLAGPESILQANFFSTCTMMVRRDGPFEIPPALAPVWGDWALKLCFALQGDTLFLPQQTALHRMTGTGPWASLSAAEMESEVLRVLQAFERHVGPAYAHVLGPRIRRQLQSVAKAWHRHGDEARAAAAAEALAAFDARAAVSPPPSPRSTNRRPAATFAVPS